MNTATKFVAWSCPHVPMHSKSTQAWMLERVQQVKPDVVILLGDLLEADAASVHPGEAEWDLDHEFSLAADYLATFREAAGPDATYVWLHGNHDDNIRRQDPRRIPKKVRSLCDWNRHDKLGAEVANWRQVPYSHRQTYRLGPVVFRHGAEAGTNADKHQCALYGVPNGLVIGGHTHSGFDVQRLLLTPRIPLDRWYGNAGCSVDWNLLGYMDRQSMAMWTHGMYVGNVSSAAVRERRALFASPQWDAKYELFERAQ